MQKHLIFFAGFLLFISCSDKLDFKQAEDFRAEPVLSVDLFYTRLNGNDFYINDTIPIMEIRDTVPFTVFKEKPVKDGLQKIMLYVQVHNELPAAFQGKIKFLKNGQPIDSVYADIQSATTNQAFDREYVFTIIKDSVPEIVLTTDLAIHFQRTDSIDISHDNRMLKAQSRGDFYVVIQ